MGTSRCGAQEAPLKDCQGKSLKRLFVWASGSTLWIRLLFLEKNPENAAALESGYCVGIYTPGVVGKIKIAL